MQCSCCIFALTCLLCGLLVNKCKLVLVLDSFAIKLAVNCIVNYVLMYIYLQCRVRVNSHLKARMKSRQIRKLCIIFNIGM